MDLHIVFTVNTSSRAQQNTALNCHKPAGNSSRLETRQIHHTFTTEIFS